MTNKDPRAGSLLVEVGVALLLITFMSYGITQYRWQTVAAQKEVLLRLRALQIVSGLLEQFLLQGCYSDGQRQIGSIQVWWHAVAWQPLFDNDRWCGPVMQRVTVTAQYDGPFLQNAAKKRSLVVCAILPKRRAPGLP